MKQKINGKKTCMLVLVIALLAFCDAVLAFCGYVLINGITVGIYDIGKVGDRMHYGLDLTGGVNVVLQAKTDDGTAVDSDKMDSTVTAIKNRVDGLGVSEATVTKQGDDRIRVSIPSIQDQQEALDLIGKTAKLEFKSPNGDVLLTGEDVTDSKAVKQQNSSGVEESVVTLKFSEAGTKKFAEATTTYLNQTISIELDGDVISAPTVNATISNGEAVIEGMSDMDEASNLAELIRGEALPLVLEPIAVSTIGPTLGQDSLQQSSPPLGLRAHRSLHHRTDSGTGFLTAEYFCRSHWRSGCPSLYAGVLPGHGPHRRFSPHHLHHGGHCPNDRHECNPNPPGNRRDDSVHRYGSGCQCHHL